jgi:hypothetical protein
VDYPNVPCKQMFVQQRIRASKFQMRHVPYVNIPFVSKHVHIENQVAAEPVTVVALQGYRTAGKIRYLNEVQNKKT